MWISDEVKWSRSVVSDSATPWTVAYQAPPSMGSSRQQYWSGLPLMSYKYTDILGFSGSSVVKTPSASAGDAGSIPGSGRSPGEGNGNPLQCSRLENLMDRGAWKVTVHGVTKSRPRLKQLNNNSLHIPSPSGASFRPCHPAILPSR